MNTVLTTVGNRCKTLNRETHAALWAYKICTRRLSARSTSLELLGEGILQQSWIERKTRVGWNVYMWEMKKERGITIKVEVFSRWEETFFCKQNILCFVYTLNSWFIHFYYQVDALRLNLGCLWYSVILVFSRNIRTTKRWLRLATAQQHGLRIQLRAVVVLFLVIVVADPIFVMLKTPVGFKDHYSQLRLYNEDRKFKNDHKQYQNFFL